MSRLSPRDEFHKQTASTGMLNNSQRQERDIHRYCHNQYAAVNANSRSQLADRSPSTFDVRERNTVNEFCVLPTRSSASCQCQSGSLPLTASDSIVALYADNFFEYDDARRVIRETVLSGSQTYYYEYHKSGFAIGYNSWFMKTIETRPDGNKNIVYSNFAGQTMLKVLQANGQQWCEFTVFDNAQAILFASPSAVNGVDETLPDLLGNNGSGIYRYLNNHSGLIRVVTYDSVSGYPTSEGVKQGQLGTLIYQRKVDYCCIPEDCECGGSSSSSSMSSGLAGCSGVYLPRRETVYPSDTDQSITEVTSYCRTFYPSTFAVKELITTLPAVTTAQNGSGVSATRRDYFDMYGNNTWSMDERGFLTRNQYDLPTGALIQQVDDADSSLYPDIPPGWSTPSGGGLNLVTDLAVDGLGRNIETLGPAFIDGTGTEVRTATWTVRFDEPHFTVSGSGYVSESATTLANPVSIMKTDASGRVNERIQAVSSLTNDSLPNILATYAADPACGVDPTFGTPPLCGLPQSEYVRWVTFQYTDCCLTASQRVYHTIPATGDGFPNVNYDETDFGYDSMKRQNRTVTPGGTITDLVYEPRGLVVGVYVGTNDAGGTESDPTGGGINPANNMVQVTANQYDNGSSGGNGNLTLAIQYVDAINVRTTCMIYDFRDRKIATDGEVDFYQMDYFDNLDRNIKTERYDTLGPAGGCGAGSSSSSGPSGSSSASTSSESSLSSTQSGSSSSGSSITNLIARNETRYDARGNVFQTVVYAVDPTTGAVGNALTDNMWFDDTGNPIKSFPAGSKLFLKTTFDSLNRAAVKYVGYGPDSTYADASSVTNNTILGQSETTFDGASHVIETAARERYHNADASQTGPLQVPSTTPKARVTYSANWFDGVGRPVANANYGTNGGTAFVRPDVPPTPSDTILVGFISYDSSGKVSTTIDPAGMVTCAFYDNAVRTVEVIENCPILNSSSSSSSSASSDIGPCANSDDTNRTTRYTYTPDGDQATMTAVNSRTGDQTTAYGYGTTLTTSDIATSNLLSSVTYPDSTSGSDVVAMTYNRQSEKTSLMDQRGCMHTFIRDGLSRLAFDCVTTLGTGVDGSVRRLGVEYEVRGMPMRLTSFDEAAIDAGSIVNDVLLAYNSFAQIVSDAQAHSGAADGTTPKVQYAYTDGSTNMIRPTILTYPNGREITIDYGSSGGISDSASRVDGLIDDDSTTLVNYAYLGLGTAVQVTYPQPGIQYTLLGSGGGNDPVTGDIYKGLDLFGRIKDSRWFNTSTNDDIDRIQYGYNRASNRIWRKNPVATAAGAQFDEFYTYDGLQRLKDMQRGTLNGTNTGIASPTFGQCWTLDPTGNWRGFAEAATGGSFTTVQTRTANPVNEITNITNSVGSAWATPSYDAAGNMTTIPGPGFGWSGMTVDDWSSLSVDDWFELPVGPGSMTATYDAWNRQVKLQDSATDDAIQENQYDARTFRTIIESYSGGALSETRHSYFSNDWRCIEERLDSATTADRQFVWGVRYIDDLILRDRDSEQLYALQDTNWNVTAVADSGGTILERYSHSAYGAPVFLTSGFAPREISDYAWETLYCGYRFDVAIRMFQIRYRAFHPRLGIWCQRDTLEYANGPSLYSLYSPLNATDPSGQFLQAVPPVLWWLLGGGTAIGGAYWWARKQNTDPPQPVPGVSNNACIFTMRDHNEARMGRNDSWEKAANDFGTNVKSSIGSRGEIASFIKDKKCCEVILIGHRGGLGNPGGIVTYLDGEARRILPDPQLENEIKAAMAKHGCKNPKLRILSCSEPSADDLTTRLMVAKRTGCTLGRANCTLAAGTGQRGPDLESKLQWTPPPAKLVSDPLEKRLPLAPWDLPPDYSYDFPVIPGQ